MRQRGQGYVGIILVMVVAGLIIYAIIYFGPSLLQQIQEGTSSGLSPSEIREHPEKYLGKTITVVGWYMSGYIIPVNPAEADTEAEAMEILGGSLQLNLPENTQVYQHAKYMFTGTLIIENDVFGLPTPTLDVTNIEPI